MKTPSDRSGAILRCVAAAVLFAAATPLSKTLLASVGPVTLAGLLYLGAAAATAPFALRGTWRPAFRTGRNLPRLAGAVLAGGVVAPVLLLLGLSRAPASSVALWMNLEPVLTTVIAVLFFREHAGPRTWTAVAAALIAGTALAAPQGFDLGVAALLVTGGCVAWAIDNNLTSLIDAFTPAQTTFVKGLVAAAVNLTLGLSIEPSPAGTTVLAACAVGVVCYGASLVLYIGGAQRLGAARSQLVFAMAPFLAVVLSWTFLGETIGPVALAAGAVLLGALVVLLTARHEHEHTHEVLHHTHSHRHDDGHHDHAHPDLPAGVRHTHEHAHEPTTHRHPHEPDLHHRHAHPG